MRYYIKQHLKFKLRKPCKRRVGRRVLPADYHTANERKDPETKLTVNVLIMAKGKKKNNSRVTAGELFGKLGRKQENVTMDVSEEEFLDDSGFVSEDDNPDEPIYDSIDVSSGSDVEPSDSDLDINELLRKYMPEYDNDENNGEDDASEPFSGGVLSKLKQTASETEVDEKNEDEKLIDALDSVFSSDAFSTEDEAMGDTSTADTSASDTSERKGRRYRSINNSDADADDVIMEYDLAASDDLGEEMDESAAEDIFEEAPKKKRGFFASLFGKSAETDEPEKAAYNFNDENRNEPLEGTLPDESEESFDDIADMIGDTEDTPNFELSLDPDDVDAADADDTQMGESDEASDDSAENSEFDENDDDIDPTDINLMVAFGLDGGKNKKADKAKEFGDRLEAKQISKAKKYKLDRAEFVDKTQTPQIRKEYHNREVGLWLRLAICAVFTIILLIFENVTVLTKLFTGTAKQFAGALDPAVYPVVYIMISLQLMLLACICAFDEIVAGFKYIFRGTPRPESMTALLTVAGIIYSAVLAHLVEVPNEPVMFNFVVALSALLTLVYAICNNKREMMNFRVVANKKPKHIVRRLLDEESECEAKAFADAEDVCDVMKIEKADFVDGFFGRLNAPDSNTGIFMTFIMSVAAAIAVLFGIFVNFRGGDSTMICRVIYSAMLIISPLSVYMTFSYPFYRANLAAKEYDSAIIGEAALEEYSNASIISFDDKNVFPSYSVKVQNIKIHNNARIDRLFYYAASVFAYAGGPLQDVFEVATKDLGISNNVQIFDTEAGFLATQVDGVNIIFGSYDALTSRGLEIPISAAEDDVDLSDELEIMYMFREDKLVAKMYIQYVMDADIDLILKQFSGSGLYVCVRTFDPNIDERMIARKLNMKRMPLKIVRYASTDEVGTYTEKVDSGLVTCGTPKSLLQVISYCGKVLHTKKTNIALSVLSVMIGTAILVLLLLSDSLETLNSLFIALYQLIWLIPMMLSSKMFIK